MLTVERGFTLPEVMLALVFGSVIALGAAKTYPLLRQQNVAVGQHFRLESTLRQLAFGIEKDLRRAGFCAGQCAGRPLLIGQAGGQLRYRRLRYHPQWAMAHLGRGCRLFRLSAAQWRLGRAARRKPMRRRRLGAAARS